uniref:Uncharacterized protein n=1 Tax=Strigamia maritima TaxID=126957 RepID=T1JD10_STRMM
MHIDLAGVLTPAKQRVIRPENQNQKTSSSGKSNQIRLINECLSSQLANVISMSLNNLSLSKSKIIQFD